MEKKRSRMYITYASVFLGIVAIMVTLTGNICYAQNISDYFYEGLEYGVAGNFEQAQKSFKKVLELEKDPSAKETVKRYLQITEDVLKQKIEAEGGIHLFQGIVKFRMFMLNQAIAEWEKAAELNPNYIMPYKMLADAYVTSNKQEEAIAMLKKIIEINPNDAETYFKLAGIYYFNKHYKLAIEHCDKAKELGLNDPELFKLLERLKPHR